MAKFIFSNFGTTQIAAPIQPDSDSVTVLPGQGALFPTPDDAKGEMFSLVMRKSDGTPEVMHCWSRDEDVLSVLRGREGTTALEWSQGSFISNRTTAEALNDWASGEFGALVVADNHFFEVESLAIEGTHNFMTVEERDTYFSNTPGELVDKVAVRVDQEFFVYDAPSEAWGQVTARDNYFALNLEDLAPGLPIWMNEVLQIWDAEKEEWRSVTALMRGPQGPVGDVTAPVIEARDAALVDIDDARVAATGEVGEVVAEGYQVLGETEAARDAAFSAANNAGAWSTLAGELLIPASTYHEGRFWILTESVADVASHEPGVSVVWQQFASVSTGKTLFVATSF